MKKVALFAIVLVGMLLSSGSTPAPNGDGQTVLPRPVVKNKQVTLKENHRYKIYVKFIDGIMVRVGTDNTLYSKAVGTLSGNALRELEEINALKKSANVKFSPVFSKPAKDLEAYRKRSEVRTGVAKHDLAGMIYIEIDEPGNIAKLEVITKMLLGMEIVETVYAKDLDAKTRAPYDIPPTTPDFSGNQSYRGPNPGMNVDYAWNTYAAKGQGVRFSDVEWSWNLAHEDLMDSNIHVQTGQTINPNSDLLFHGTGVIGISAAGDNGYGVKGIAPDASFWVYPVEPQGFMNALQQAIEDSGPGDVVLIENSFDDGMGWGGPMEMDADIWALIRDAADNGVIVIEPAGNANANFESVGFSEWTGWGDSGGIIVGGGRMEKYHGNHGGGYGWPVDIQAWGHATYSTSSLNSADVQGYSYFGGTSGAGALVAGACTILQSAAKTHMGRPLTPVEMRTLLQQSGIRQDEGLAIGRAIDLAAAVNSIELQGGGSFNYSPAVDIGNDVVLNWPYNAVSLSATVTDPGDSVSYSWLQLGGPAAVSFTNPFATNTIVSFPQIGKYTLRFIATDSLYQIGVDDLVVYVSRPSVTGYTAPVGDVDKDTFAQDLTVSGNLAFFSARKGLRVVDISTPASPSTVGLWSKECLGDREGLVDIEADGNYAYAAYCDLDNPSADRIYFINATTPSVPSQAGYYNVATDPCNGFAVSNNVLYIAKGINGVDFVDVTNKASPSLLHHYGLGQSFQFLRLSGSYLYFYNTLENYEELLIVDVHDIYNPVQVGSLSFTGKKCADLDVAGNYVYLLIKGEGLKIVDVTTKSNPVLAGTFAATDSYDAAYSDGFLYLGSSFVDPSTSDHVTKEIKIVDVRTPASPVLDSCYALTVSTLRYNNFINSCEKLYSPTNSKNIFVLGRTIAIPDVWRDKLVILDTNARLDVTINQAAGQADPTKTAPINFTVIFSRAVTDFAAGDVTISGTAGGTKTVTVTGSGTTYNIAVSGMTSKGTIVATIAAGVAHDTYGNANLASTSTDNTVSWYNSVAYLSSTASTASSFSVTKASGTNRLLLVFANSRRTNNSPSLVFSMSYGGQALTKLSERTYNGTNPTVVNSVWYLKESGVNAASGTTLSITWNNAPTTQQNWAVFLQKVDQTTPYANIKGGDSTSTTVSTTAVNTTPGVMGFLGVASIVTTNTTYSGITSGFTKVEASGSTAFDAAYGYLGYTTTGSYTPTITRANSNKQTMQGFIIQGY